MPFTVSSRSAGAISRLADRFQCGLSADFALIRELFTILSDFKIISS